MKNYITETWLREHGAMAEGAEICLPAGACLTPAAHSLISDRRLQVKYADDKPSSVSGNAAASSQRPHIHPLTGRDRGEGRHPMQCALCHQNVGGKPDVLTHLNADRLVPKNDERIGFRGRIDSAIACAVWIQAEWMEKTGEQNGAVVSQFLAQGLSDVRSCLGNVLRAEVTGEPLAPIRMGPHDEEAIHRISHDPWKHLGHDHIVPEASHGLSAARLNLLRASIRETEVAAAGIYIDRDFEVLRPDIMQGLNRMSSAVYVLMIIAVMQKKGLSLKEGAWN